MEFKKLTQELEPTINVNLASAQEHVPEAERNNRTIQERIRSIYHTLPFDALPSTLLKYLVMFATEKLNYFTPKGGSIPKFQSQGHYTWSGPRLSKTLQVYLLAVCFGS